MQVGFLYWRCHILRLVRTAAGLAVRADDLPGELLERFRDDVRCGRVPYPTN